MRPIVADAVKASKMEDDSVHPLDSFFARTQHSNVA